MHAMPRLLLAAAALHLTVVTAAAALMAGSDERPSMTRAQDLPDGAGKELLPRLCAGCHDLMFTVSTRETAEGWTRIVNDMRAKGADGTEKEFEMVIAYLAANFGKAERLALVP